MQNDTDLILLVSNRTIGRHYSVTTTQKKSPLALAGPFVRNMSTHLRTCIARHDPNKVSRIAQHLFREVPTFLDFRAVAGAERAKRAARGPTRSRPVMLRIGGRKP